MSRFETGHAARGYFIGATAAVDFRTSTGDVLARFGRGCFRAMCVERLFS
jgi:hypothetical protein